MAKKKTASNAVISGELMDVMTGAPVGDLEVRALSALHGKTVVASGRAGKEGRFKLEYRKNSAAKEVAQDRQRGPALRLEVHGKGKKSLVHLSEERSGKDRFAHWVVAMTGLVAEREAQVFSENLARELHALLKRPKFLKPISHFLAEESGADPKMVYQELTKLNPFGIDPFTFRTTICCLLNNLFDDFKQTAFGQLVAVGGNTYKHLGSVSQVFGVAELIGTIEGPVNSGSWIDDGVEGRTEIDQDFNFKLNPSTPLYSVAVDRIGMLGAIPSDEIQDLRETLTDIRNDFFSRIQCEIVPCDQTGSMRRVMGELRSRARIEDARRRATGMWTPLEVAMTGEVTFDGTHPGTPAHWEVHPVKNLRIL